MSYEVVLLRTTAVSVANNPALRTRREEDDDVDESHKGGRHVGMAMNDDV